LQRRREAIVERTFAALETTLTSHKKVRTFNR